MKSIYRIGERYILIDSFGLIPPVRSFAQQDIIFYYIVQINSNLWGNMAKIEHVAMYVNELEEARDLFVKYLEGSSNAGYHNQNTGFRSYFISFEDGSRLEIMNKPGLVDMEKNLNRTGYVHIAFSVGSKEKVDEITARLQEDGFEVISGPRTTGDGYYESCIVAIEGNQIEITE